MTFRPGHLRHVSKLLVIAAGSCCPGRHAAACSEPHKARDNDAQADSRQADAALLDRQGQVGRPRGGPGETRLRAGHSFLSVPPVFSFSQANKEYR